MVIRRRSKPTTDLRPFGEVMRSALEKIESAFVTGTPIDENDQEAEASNPEFWSPSADD